MHTYAYACIHTYIHTCIHTYMHATCIHAYIHTYKGPLVVVYIYIGSSETTVGYGRFGGYVKLEGHSIINGDANRSIHK